MDARKEQFKKDALAYAESGGDGALLSAVIAPVVADLTDMINRYDILGHPFVIAAMELTAASLRNADPQASDVADGIKLMLGVNLVRTPEEGCHDK